MGSGASSNRVKPTLYIFPLSAPCRAVMMTAKAANINLDVKIIDLLKGEQKEEAFLKINPDHTVPTLVVEGTIRLWESRAIQQFLIDMYAPNHPLYPRDPVKRAYVDRMQQYSLSTVFKTVREYMMPQMFDKKDPDPEKAKEVEKVLEYLDNILKDSKYVSADHLTLSDLSIISDLSMLDLKDWGYERWPHVQQWRESIRKEGWYAEVNKSVDEFRVKLAQPA